MAGSLTAERLAPFGTSVFSEVTALAARHGAINLAQGFPDFDGPAEIIAAAGRAMAEGQNQYARSMGLPALTRAVADRVDRLYGLSYDPLTEVGVFSGATEGLAAAVLGLVNPGDEVILFEPFYDSYPACVAMAGGRARYITLAFPDFGLDVGALAGVFNPRTRLVILNTPHNPTGKVFTRDELGTIAELCQRHDVLVLTDEVYEHLTYDAAVHVPMATLPGMRQRTLTLSSAGKTFSLTGWKVGWGTGPAALVAAAQAAHQFLTFCSATPLQAAVAWALENFGDDYYAAFQASYATRRDLLIGILRAAGFRLAEPAGTYFALASLDGLWDGDDWSFVRHLVTERGVAAIPASAFYAQAVGEGQHLIRFAFCKTAATIAAAGERLQDRDP
jgi:N-succinyldiaminopimelate aminotransferase